jgi:putative glycosyltransferase (TIGR04372 family)
VRGAAQLLQLLETHDLLAEDIINTTGDIEAALRLYRRKHQLQRQFSAAFGLDPERILYLPADWVRNIGHLALLDFWVKMKHLGWRSWEQMILLAPPRTTANDAYLSYWKQHFTVISDPHLLRTFSPLATLLGNRVAGLLTLPTGEDHYFCEGMGVIQEAWERQGRPPLLTLNPDEREQGWAALKQLGVPDRAWFVSLHVRSSGFHKEGDSAQQAHRNADIRSYLPAVRRIIERGGWVVQLGDDSMAPLPPLPGLIDYAHSPLKSPQMDVFLCASCRFFIGVASGMSNIPTTFGVPCALTNWVSNPFPVASAGDRFIPKLLWSERAKRFLRFPEALEPATRRLGYCGEKLRAGGLRAIDNTPEEITDLVEEMFEADDTPADEERQRTFRELAHGAGLVGFSRIGRAFLRKHAHLLAQPHKFALSAPRTAE